MDSFEWILLLWFGFPPIAILLSWLWGRRIRLKNEPQTDEPNSFQSFTPSTYAYYPLRGGSQKLPPPSVAFTSRKKDAVLATLAVILGILGLYLPIIGILLAPFAMALAWRVFRCKNHHYSRAVFGFCLGAMTLVQTVLYLLCG